MLGDKQKYGNLDGLRGLAAASVVLLHYATAFAPFLVGYATIRHSALDKAVSTTPLGLPFAGNFAVCIFFVLSGFVLSLSFFRHKDTFVLVSSAARRYFRLMLPAFGSVILAYLVMKFVGFNTQPTAAITESSTWLASFWTFPEKIASAVYQGIYGQFFSVGFPSYNVVLWTMHYELYGSFLVFMFLAFFGKLTNRWIFYGLFSLVFIQQYYLAFIIGTAIADLFINYPEKVAAIKDRVLWCLLPVGLILGTWAGSYTIYPTVYGKLHLPTFEAYELEILAHIVGATIAVFAVLKLRPLARMFETKFMQYLGRISFSLYLTHLIVLGVFACGVFNLLFPHFGYKFSVMLTFIISMPVTFAVATLYTRFVDVPSIALSKRIGLALTSDENLFSKWQLSLKKRFTWSRKQTAPEFTASATEETA